MRQYVIFYRRAGMPSFIPLRPLMDSSLYERDAVRHAVDHLRRTEFVQGMCVQGDSDELYNVMCFEQDAKAPNAFGFDDTISINEPIDNLATLRAAGLTEPAGTCCNCTGEEGTEGVDGSDEPEITAMSKDGQTKLRLFR